jgi:membrane associated rhomboid family serine protease
MAETRSGHDGPTVRIVITPYSVLAFVLVVLVAGLLAVVAHRLAWWARRMATTAPVLGVVGVVLTVAAAANVLVPRSCAEGVHNRPLLSAFTGDACRPAGVAQLALAVLVGVAATAAVRTAAARRVGDPHDVPVP